MMPTARAAGVLIVTLVLMLLLAGNARADETRPVIKAELLDVSANFPFAYEYSLVRVGGGARFGEHVGVTADVALMSGGGFLFWPLVPTATVFWDFDPHRTWQRSLVYFKVSARHTSWTIDDMDYWTGVKLSLGASYTWYAVTPHIEADLIMPAHFRYNLGGTAGITIGGTYVLQPRKQHADD